MARSQIPGFNTQPGNGARITPNKAFFHKVNLYSSTDFLNPCQVKRCAKDRLFMASNLELLTALTPQQEFSYSGPDLSVHWQRA